MRRSSAGTGVMTRALRSASSAWERALVASSAGDGKRFSRRKIAYETIKFVPTPRAGNRASCCASCGHVRRTQTMCHPRPAECVVGLSAAATVCQRRIGVRCARTDGGKSTDCSERVACARRASSGRALPAGGGVDVARTFRGATRRRRRRRRCGVGGGRGAKLRLARPPALRRPTSDADVVFADVQRKMCVAVRPVQHRSRLWVGRRFGTRTVVQSYRDLRLGKIWIFSVRKC